MPGLYLAAQSLPAQLSAADLLPCKNVVSCGVSWRTCIISYLAGAVGIIGKQLFQAVVLKR